MNTAISSPPLKWHVFERRHIPDCSRYFAGDDGSIWRLRNGNWKALLPDARPCDGRKRYTIFRDDGTRLRKYGGEFVLCAFVGPRPSGQECCHENGDCTNDAIWNLRWDTVIANKADMLRHGTRLMGENHPKTKLSNEDIEQIIRRRREGEMLRGLGVAFGVSGERISQIARKGGR